MDKLYFGYVSFINGEVIGINKTKGGAADRISKRLLAMNRDERKAVTGCKIEKRRLEYDSNNEIILGCLTDGNYIEDGFVLDYHIYSVKYDWIAYNKNEEIVIDNKTSAFPHNYDEMLDMAKEITNDRFTYGGLYDAVTEHKNVIGNVLDEFLMVSIRDNLDELKDVGAKKVVAKATVTKPDGSTEVIQNVEYIPI